MKFLSRFRSGFGMVAALAMAITLFAIAPTLAAYMTLTVRAGIVGTYRNANPLGAQEFTFALDGSQNFNTGTGDYGADLLYSSERTLAASGTEDLDVIGSLTDAFGTTLSMVEVVAIYVEASCTNTNNVVIGAATQPIPLGFGGTTPTWAVQPCGRFLVTAPKAGWAAGAGATDDIKIANSAGTTGVTYRIVILGRSA